MCGICGWLNTNCKVDGSVVERMNNVSKHRGPDDEGYMAFSASRFFDLEGDDSCKGRKYDGHIRNLSDKDIFLALGHRRLSIIDLSVQGHQPMHDEHDNVFITYNGEIYNYIELKEELAGKGYVFHTGSDTEMIIAAYIEWGEDCVLHFDGMWAFAIWDKVKCKLFCSRDRLGAKPFYYFHNDEEFIFSSEIKQLCQNPRVPRKLDMDTFASQIIFDISDYSESTLIKDIKALNGGSNLSLELDTQFKKIKSFSIYNYWNPSISEKDPEASKDTFSLLENAIRIRLRSDVPVGVLLSGGVDSSCITAYISDYLHGKDGDSATIDTFTSCYENFSSGDEKNYAEMVNDHCNTKPHYIYPTTSNSFNVLEQLVWMLEGNCIFQNIGSFLLLEEVKKSGIKVLINGQGADETQFGYERYYAFYLKDILAQGRFKEAIKAFSLARKNSRLNAKDLVAYYFYFNHYRLRKMRCIKRVKNYVSKSLIEEINNSREYRALFTNKGMDEMLFHEIRNIQLPHILRMDDRLYMAHSLESRVPFIDYKYIESSMKIPEHEKIQQGYTKYLLRNHFSSKLPKDVIWRKNKMGWPSPAKKWVSAFNPQKVDDLFDNPRTGSLFNVDKIRELYASNPTSYAVEKFMVAELFIRMFDVSVELS